MLVATLETTLLTPNERLARHLRQEDDAVRRAGGAMVWETPEILSWDSWLLRMWDEGLPMDSRRPALLTPVQEQALWQRVLEDSRMPLLNPAATARTATQAHRLLQDHGLTLDPFDLFLDDDSRAFAEWAAEFRRRCDERGWLDPARLPEALEKRLKDAALPEVLRLQGFDELPPRRQRLLEAIRRAGTVVHLEEDDREPGAFARASYPGPEEEAHAAARWARRILGHQPEARIGLVVPDLQDRRALLERALEDVLQPGALVKPGQRLFNVSLGRQLAHVPAVHDALEILALALGPRPLDRVGGLLGSPFLPGADAERGPRALLDAALRRRLMPSAGLDRLLRFARAEEKPYSAPLLAERLDRLQQAAAGLPERQSPARWAEAFDGLLQAAGWPGDAPTSELMQAVVRWREVLAGLRQLDGIWPALTPRKALELARSMALQAVFQPRGPEAAVQALGLLEAAGLDFDHLWIMGLHDEAWPAASRPNPFLPLDLQRRHEMPHSSPARELDFARRLTRRLLAGAPRGVVSWPEREGDRELRPSFLIRHLPEGTPAEAATPLWRTLLFRQGGVQPTEDQPPPPLDQRAVKGGTRLFKLQAACPFRAFAELRLGAEPLEPLQHGLTARERGVLMHSALEAAWRALGSQERMLQADLPQVAAEAARHAVAALAPQRPDLLHGRFREMEAERLQRLVLEWLEVERERSPFVVLGSEKTVRLEMAGLEFETQIDRLDRLEDGTLAVIDYKTGRPSVRHWLGDRPDEPQLPLYCSGAGGRPSAVLFAQVRPGEMAFKGVSERPGLHPQVPPFERTDFAAEAGTWEDLLDRWRAVLTSLAAQFREGYAPVAPKRRDVCRTCTQQPLCRVHSLEEP